MKTNKNIARLLTAVIILSVIAIIGMALERTYHPRQLFRGPKANATAEKPAKFYAIQWLSGLTNFQVDAASLAALTTPKNGDMIEVVGYYRSASTDKIFGLSYAAAFFEIRPLDQKETDEILQRGRKDHFVLTVFKKSQPQPSDFKKRYSTKGVWNFPLNERPYIEVVKIKEYEP